MNTLDIILAVIMLFGAVRGFMKGLFVEVTSLIALIAGVYGAIHFSYFVGDYLVDKISWSQQGINLLAFAITFVIIIIVIAMAGKALTKLADLAALGIVNKVFGAVFGALKFGLILSVLLVLFSHTNNTIKFVKKEQLEGSILYAPVKKLAPMLFPQVLNKAEEELETI